MMQDQKPALNGDLCAVYSQSVPCEYTFACRQVPK